jgi:hypothetical protein
MLRLPRFDGHGFGALREYDTSGFTQATFGRSRGAWGEYPTFVSWKGRSAVPWLAKGGVPRDPPDV